MHNVILWEMPGIPVLPFWLENSRFWQIFPASHSHLIFSWFLKLFLFFVSPVFLALLCPFFCSFSAIFTLLASKHELVIVLVCGISTDWDLKMQQNGILEAHILQDMPLEPPRGSCLQRSWAQLCCPKNLPFLLNRVGISEMPIHFQ